MSDQKYKLQISTKQTDSDEPYGIESPILTDIEITESSMGPTFTNSLYLPKPNKNGLNRVTPNIDVLVFGQPNSGKDVFVE